MPVNSQGRKYLSDLVKGVDGFTGESAVDFNFATVDVGGSLTTFEPVGTPLVWNNTNSRFEVYLAQDISAVTGSPLPNGSPICLAVGTSEGVGFNKAALDLTTDPKVTVLFRGPAGVSGAGIEWAGATQTNQDEFTAQLEVQGIAIVASGETVTPSYV